jgi:hypothetical protein
MTPLLSHSQHRKRHELLQGYLLSGQVTLKEFIPFSQPPEPLTSADYPSAPSPRAHSRRTRTQNAQCSDCVLAVAISKTSVPSIACHNANVHWGGPRPASRSVCHRIAPTGTPTVIAFAMCLITSSGFFQVEFKSPMTQIRITLRETSIASLEVVVP